MLIGHGDHKLIFRFQEIGGGVGEAFLSNSLKSGPKSFGKNFFGGNVGGVKWGQGAAREGVI